MVEAALAAGAAAVPAGPGGPAPRLVDLSRPDTLIRAIDARRRCREERLASLRRAAEYDELRGCTFMPRTAAAGHAASTGSGGGVEEQGSDGGGGAGGGAAGCRVEIRGLGRFLELKQRAKALEDEKK